MVWVGVISELVPLRTFLLKAQERLVQLNHRAPPGRVVERGHATHGSVTE